MKKKALTAACPVLVMVGAALLAGLILLASVASFPCAAMSGAEPAATPAGQGAATNRPGLASAKTAEEPLLDRFSPVKAAEFLDAKRQVDEKGCLTCHGTYSYLVVKPLFASSRKTYREARLALEKDVVKQTSLGAQTNLAGMPVVYAVMGAATLAQLDAATTGKLQPLTREALDRMWELQRDDGHWEWEKQNEAPSAMDDHFGATLAAIAAGAAPENHADTPNARQGMAKLRDYFRNHPPQNLHHRTLLLLASHYLRGLVTEADRQQTVADLWALQRPDGGWAMGALGNWKRKDGKPQNLVASDGYGTGLVTQGDCTITHVPTRTWSR